jgi:F-type H+-transporting ATPase subunit alpha
VKQLKYPLVAIKGLPGAHPYETLIFEEGQIGQVFDMDGDYVNALVYSGQNISLGAKVTRTNEPLTIPVGEAVLGTTIDALGRPLRMGQTFSTRIDRREVFTDTLGIDSRVTITKPFLTGLTKVDLLIPLGKGQRELLLGDAKTGKTTFLLNTLVHQIREEKNIGVYIAIGKKRSEIRFLEEFFVREKIADRIVIVATTASDNASMIYLAPYAGMTIAEYFRDKGRNVLVVMDDLTTHAQRYREIALLSKRFPGRESYPGDIFYAHASLMERAGNFKFAGTGEVSITLLPIASTVEGDITGYISTNIISMTDGHIFFDTEIYNKGERPAINIPLSVTRVGRKTQTPLVRQVNREILSLLSQFRTLSQIAHLDAELSFESKEILAKGKSLMGMLNQESGIIPYDIQIVLFGIVWLKLADLSDDTIKAPLLQGLLALYLNPAERVQIQQLTSQKELSQFLLLLKQKTDIIELCKKKQNLPAK